MKNNKKFKPLSLKLFTSIAGTVALIVAVFCLFNALFFPKYYMKREQEHLALTLDSVSNILNRKDFSVIDKSIELEKLSNDTNIDFIIFSPDKTVTYSSVPQGAIRYRAVFPRSSNKNTKGKNLLKVTPENNSYIINTNYLTALNTETIELFSILKSGYSVQLLTGVAPIKNGIVIFNKFILTLGVLCCFIILVCALWISRSLTRPLKELSAIANDMSSLKFEKKYEGSSNDEVGLLGESMNKMSDKLEKSITDLKNANIHLAQDVNRYEELVNSKNEFLSNVSHELKTPVSIIEAYAEGLSEMSLDENTRNNYCEVIIDESKKLNLLFRKLQSLMNLTSGAEHLDIQRYDISSQISEILKQKELLFRQSNLKVEFENNMPIYVWADEFLIEEVLLNYLTNAMKYSTGERLCKISAETTDGTCRVSVFNTGNHISDEEAEKIWSSFYMIDKSRKRENDSQGLGLSIVSAIMKAHNKSCGMENTEGGVTFWFDLDASE